MKIILLFLLLLPPLAQGTTFEQITTSIHDICPLTKNLAIKKAIIELNERSDCAGPFSLSVLKDCPRLNCSQLSNIVNSYTTSRSGAVIGR